MKKIIALIMVISCFAVFLCGCEKQKEEMVECVDAFTISGDDVQTEYMEYINSKKEELPSKFLTLKDCYKIGILTTYVELLGTQQVFYSFRSPQCKDETGDMCLYVYYVNRYKKAPKYKRKIKEKYINRNDMSVLNTSYEKKQMRRYEYNEISYIYFGENLYSVKWVAGGVYYCLVLEEDTAYTSCEFIPKLLNLDTAVQVVTEMFGEPTPIKAFFEE